MNKDDIYMEIAYNEAKKALKSDEVPVGAVIVLNDIIIAKAHNVKDSTGVVTNHAEIVAIHEASKIVGDWRLSNSVMYVTLEPCPMCASAIQQSRISKIVYATSSDFADNHKILNLILNNTNSYHLVKMIKNSRYEDSCKKLMSDFFKNKR